MTTFSFCVYIVNVRYDVTYVGKENFMLGNLYMEIILSSEMEIYICPSPERRIDTFIAWANGTYHLLKQEKSSEFLKGKSHMMHILEVS